MFGACRPAASVAFVSAVAIARPKSDIRQQRGELAFALGLSRNDETPDLLVR